MSNYEKQIKNLKKQRDKIDNEINILEKKLIRESPSIKVYILNHGTWEIREFYVSKKEYDDKTNNGNRFGTISAYKDEEREVYYTYLHLQYLDTDKVKLLEKQKKDEEKTVNYHQNNINKIENIIEKLKHE